MGAQRETHSLAFLLSSHKNVRQLSLALMGLCSSRSSFPIHPGGWRLSLLGNQGYRTDQEQPCPSWGCWYEQDLVEALAICDWQQEGLPRSWKVKVK